MVGLVGCSRQHSTACTTLGLHSSRRMRVMIAQVKTAVMGRNQEPAAHEACNPGRPLTLTDACGAQVECSCISVQLCRLTRLHQAIDNDGGHQHVCLQQAKVGLRAECHSDYSCTPQSACCALSSTAQVFKCSITVHRFACSAVQQMGQRSTAAD